MFTSLNKRQGKTRHSVQQPTVHCRNDNWECELTSSRQSALLDVVPLCDFFIEQYPSLDQTIDCTEARAAPPRAISEDHMEAAKRLLCPRCCLPTFVMTASFDSISRSCFACAEVVVRAVDQLARRQSGFTVGNKAHKGQPEGSLCKPSATLNRMTRASSIGPAISFTS